MEYRHYRAYPVKWSIISMGTIIFWSQCIILLGYHFTGARSCVLLVYHFTEVSFYWNNFVKVSVPFLSVSFYDSTLKIYSTMYHFTGSIWLHWYQQNHHFFSPNPLTGTTIHYSTVPPPLNSWVRTRTYMCIYFWVVNDWNITNPHCGHRYCQYYDVYFKWLKWNASR